MNFLHEKLVMLRTACTVILFYLYLKGSENILLSKSLKEMAILNSEWFKCADKLISDHITNNDQYKYCNKNRKGKKMTR